MPLGGIGAGNVSLAGDGGLRHWQLFNQAEHVAHIPHSFFALWTQTFGWEDPVLRVLQSGALYDDGDFEAAPLCTDHLVPQASRDLLAACPGVESVEFEGEYPFARVRYQDAALPVEVALEAFSPVIPLDEKDSSLPAVLFTFRLTNPGEHTVSCCLAASLQNAVGFVPGTTVTGVLNSGYGGNHNSLFHLQEGVGISMQNARLEANSAQAGSMALFTTSKQALAKTQWDDLPAFFAELKRTGRLEGRDATPSASGHTWNGALAVPFNLAPGATEEVTFILAWHFPNRYVNWDQGWLGVPGSKSQYYLGNRYNNWFAGATEVVDYVAGNLPRLREQTSTFVSALFDSPLPYSLLDAVSSQVSTIFSPTCIQDEAGNLFGFEGCCGASAGGPLAMCGCCPLNCTHVWNYEMTLSKLYPRLERSVREIDLHIQMTSEGGIPHRTVAPLLLPRWQDRGPESDVVAADGHFGTILKSYREWLVSGDEDFLARAFPKVKLALQFAVSRWDQDSDGMLDGAQWNTFDLNFWGFNTFCTSLYLAALRAAEEMARRLGETEIADAWHSRFESGRAKVEQELWNGEYYEQHFDEAAHPDYQYGKGCLSDQLFGQWWASLLDLGYILDPARVKTTLESIYKYNYMERIGDFKQQPRVFANPEEAGLLTTTWPYGGRQETPMLYCDEFWTGIEFKVASELLMEGYLDEARTVWEAARNRYDGRRRSPWNDLECGDHYARPMSSWALLEAASGFFYSTPDSLLRFAPRLSYDDFASFFITGTGWGRFSQQRTETGLAVKLEALWGKVEFEALELGLPEGVAEVRLGRADTKVEVEAGRARLKFLAPVKLEAGETLELELGFQD